MDIETTDHREQLSRVSKQVAYIADMLATLAAGAERRDHALDPAAELAFLRTMMRLRHLRFRHFDVSLFADPAWDMLIDLRMASLQGRDVSVSSLCIAASVPATTGLRWIGVLTKRGLLERVADVHDARRTFIRLQPEGEVAMGRFAAEGSRLVG